MSKVVSIMLIAASTHKAFVRADYQFSREFSTYRVVDSLDEFVAPDAELETVVEKNAKGVDVRRPAKPGDEAWLGPNWRAARRAAAAANVITPQIIDVINREPALTLRESTQEEADELAELQAKFGPAVNGDVAATMAAMSTKIAQLEGRLMSLSLGDKA